MATIVFIDNVLGGGKTTLIRELKRMHSDWEIIPEGIDFEIFSLNISTKSKEDLFMAQIFANYNAALKTNSKIYIADRTYDSVYRWAYATKRKPTRFIKEITASIQTKLDGINKLCICLEDYNLETTLDNIKRRGRAFESHYSKKSLLKLKKGYNTHFPGFNHTASITFAVNPINYEYFPILAENFIQSHC